MYVLAGDADNMLAKREASLEYLIEYLHHRMVIVWVTASAVDVAAMWMFWCAWLFSGGKSE